MQVIETIKKKLTALGRVSVVRTFFYNLRYGMFPFSIIIYPNVHFATGDNVGIKNSNGRLHIGCKWDISRYRESEFKICDSALIEIKGNFSIYTGCRIDICRSAKVSFGSGYMNVGCRLVAFKEISIGYGVAISENVTLRDSDNHSLTGSEHPESMPIFIGNNVWIGMNSTILKGVTIGDGAVIAANSLVNKDVPANTMVGGVPARILRENISWQ